MTFSGRLFKLTLLSLVQGTTAQLKCICKKKHHSSGLRIFPHIWANTKYHAYSPKNPYKLLDACCLTCFSHCFSPPPLGKPLIEDPYPVGCSTRMPLYNGYGQHCRTVFTSSKASPKTRQNLWSCQSPEFRTPKVFNLKK